MPTILLKKSDTPGSVPGTANLTNLAGGAEVAVNTADKRMFSMTSASAVVELGTNPSSLTCADGSFVLLKAASASITNLTATSLVLSNLSIASANITTLTSSSATISTTLALSGGTANGVLYLNGSKVATSGSALTFDGTTLANINSDGTGFSTQSAASNFSIMRFGTDSVNGYAFFQSGKSGTGTTLPFAWRQDSSELMRLTSTGLGIGTSSPGYKLDVNTTGGSAATARLNGNDQANVRLRLENGGSGGRTWELVGGLPGANNSNFSLYDVTGTATRLTVDSSGNLGIGTSSPSYKLDVQSGTAVVQIRSSTTTSGAIPKLRFEHAGNDAFSIVGGSYMAWLSSDTTERMRLDSSGNLGIGTASPGSKLSLGTGTTSTTDTACSFRLYDVGGANGNNYGFGFNTSDGRFAYTAGLTGYHAFFTANTERMRLDSSGNLGLGVTPSAWGTYKAFEFAAGGALWGAANSTVLNANTYFNGTNFIYKATGTASYYQQASGEHRFFNAASGTAGNAITFTQAMTLDANGVLLRGNTTARSTNAFGTGQMQVEAASYSAFQMFANANNTDGSYMALWKSRGGALGGTTIVQNGDVCGAIYFGGYDGTTAQPAAYIGAFVDGTPGASDMPGRLIFSTTADGSINPVERARITSGGYFKASNDGTYVGSTGNYHEFRSSNNTYTAYITNTNASPLGTVIEYSSVSPNGTGNVFLYCGDSTALRAEIRSNGGIANYSANNVALSDARIKNSITPAASMWDKVAALEIVAYKYNDQTHDDVNLGVIAQQVEAVEPAWVDADGFGKTPEGEEPLKTVYTTDIKFAAIKALQEAMARIEQLEAKVAALETK